MIKGSHLTNEHKKKLSEAHLKQENKKCHSIPHTIQTKKIISEKLRKPITWIENEKGCHICTSHKPNKTSGYPLMSNFRKIDSLYRHIYEKEKGIIPKGMVIRHTCDDRLCININHLIIGTNADNSRDMIERDRQAKGETNARHKLTEQQAIEIFKSKSAGKILAKKYGVSITNINLIKRGEIWGHITLRNKSFLEDSN